MIEVTVTRDQHTIAASEVEATEPVSITPMSIPDGEGYDKVPPPKKKAKSLLY